MNFLFENFLKAEAACRVTVFVSEIFNLLILGFYLLHICNSYRPNQLTDLVKFLFDIMAAITYNANKEIKAASQN